MRIKRVSSIMLSLAMVATFSFVGLGPVSAASKNVKSKTSYSESQVSLAPQVSSFSVKAAAKKQSNIVDAGSTSTVYNGSRVVIRHKNYDQVKTYFKIKPKTSGALNISTYAGSYVSVKGANAGYVYSGASNPQYRYITFGVKKGKTYTVTVKSSGVYENGVHRNVVYFQTKSFDGKFGKSAKKAAKLSKNKERKGFIEPNGKPKYYKLSKKGKKIKITFKASANERLQITITGKAKGIKKYTRYDQTARGGYNMKVITLKMYGSARNFSGTVQVKRVGKSSGVYSVKYQ